MKNSSFAAQAVADGLIAWLTVGTVCAWLVMLALLVTPVWRLARRRARSLDALWGFLLLGVANRLVSDFAGIQPELSRLSAILLALSLALVIRSYQNADR